MGYLANKQVRMICSEIEFLTFLIIVDPIQKLLKALYNILEIEIQANIPSLPHYAISEVIMIHNFLSHYFQYY